MRLFKELEQFMREKIGLDDVYVTKDEYCKLLDRIEDLEIEKEMSQWDLKKFAEEYQFARIRELTSRKRKIFVRLLKPKSKLPIAILKRGCFFNDVLKFEFALGYYQIYDDMFVGQIYKDFVKSEEVKDAENKTPAEVSA